MVFADLTTGNGRCDFPFNVDCGDRPELRKIEIFFLFTFSIFLKNYFNELEPPQPSTNCPRRNGYFPHPDPKVCDQFFFCSDGQFNLITCPSGLVFNEKTGTCSWPGEANRVGCGSDEVINFKCPERTEADTTSGVVNPLFPDPDDCQYFYVCINGKEPRRNGCTSGLVFNNVNKRCDKPKNVPEW